MVKHKLHNIRSNMIWFIQLKRCINNLRKWNSASKAANLARQNYSHFYCISLLQIINDSSMNGIRWYIDALQPSLNSHQMERKFFFHEIKSYHENRGLSKSYFQSRLYLSEKVPGAIKTPHGVRCIKILQFQN